jgi:molecular chaperone GrpE
MKKKQDHFEQLEKEHKELKELLQRNLAEFQNYQKRTEKDKEQLIKSASISLIKKLLPTLDNLELALNNNHEKNEFTKGIEMIYSQLTETLEQEGLQKIEASGKFNPELHEALLAEKSKEEKNTIIQELQKGYTVSGRVIRHTKVKISKGDEQ